MRGVRLLVVLAVGCASRPPPPPAAADRDLDGVPDAVDACPITKGPPTGDPATNGCPPDRDHDRVADEDDACVDVPGIATNDPTTTGCPPDTDGDGIHDVADACPTSRGPHTLDPATNGCDLDRDRDGIANEADACVDDAGPADVDPRRSGCPPAFLRGKEIRILDQPRFRGAELLDKESAVVLGEVGKVLARRAEIRRVRIEAHTDDRGDAVANRKLSAARAEAVVRWLVAHGVEPARLAAEGLGGDRPADTNETEAGRARNRRIELHVDP